MAHFAGAGGGGAGAGAGAVNIDELFNRCIKKTDDKINLLQILYDLGTVQSRYLCKDDEFEKNRKKHLVLDTNHDFKIQISGWERELFNNTRKIQPTTIGIGSPNEMATFFGDRGSGNYTVYVSLDAVSFPSDGRPSRLGLFNTPIRWWDGGADSDKIVVDKIVLDETKLYKYETETDYSQNQETLDVTPTYGCAPAVSPPRIHVQPKREVHIGTQGANANHVGRDLNWTIQYKFMNIHNFYLPLLHLSHLVYDLILNLEGDIFTLTLKSGEYREVCLLNNTKKKPILNCVSKTQVNEMVDLLKNHFNIHGKKSDIPLIDYFQAMDKAKDTKEDYWNIKSCLNNIYNFFNYTTKDIKFEDFKIKNNTLLLLLIFFLYNLKRSGDIGQIEAVYLLQQAYPHKEFVYLTLDSHAAKIARDVYEINVGLLIENKGYFDCYKRKKNIGSGSVGSANSNSGEDESHAKGKGLLNAFNASMNASMNSPYGKKIPFENLKDEIQKQLINLSKPIPYPERNRARVMSSVNPPNQFIELSNGSFIERLTYRPSFGQSPIVAFYIPSSMRRTNFTKRFRKRNRKQRKTRKV
jgi:hypothetical protein